MTRIVLLGPQRLRPTLVTAADELAPEGPIAAITAGWEEREEEDDELAAHLRGRTVNLRLHGRGEELFERQPRLLAVARRFRERRRELRNIYRLRLNHALDAARGLLDHEADPELLDPAIEDAFEAVHRLDEEHLELVAAARRRRQYEWADIADRGLDEQRRELRQIVEGCAAVALAGGHVEVLLERIDLFELPPLLGARPVLAWSAGAMALADRVVLFHDSPPQGFGYAELLGPGVGLVSTLLPFPHARRRLRLGDRRRVSILARRFAPRTCVPMDEGDRLLLDDGAVEPGPDLRRLTTEGRIEPFAPRP